MLSKGKPMRSSVLSIVLAILSVQLVAAAPVRIGAESLVPENPRSIYDRYVNWRPADGEVVKLNPPRISWPYRPDWPKNWGSASHTFRLQISAKADMSAPVVDAESIYNFNNSVPVLKGADTWYWRVGYDVGSAKEKWSDIHSFRIAPDAVEWDRAKLARPDLKAMGHPRILMHKDNMDALRKLAETNDSSRATLQYMKEQADKIMRKPWWNKLPDVDAGKFPKQDYYRIAHDLATVCFVWKMTGDDRYADVKTNAVKWATYEPGGRSSPEGLGGDGGEDATQGNEFLALLFDWLYNDLNDAERRVMIKSLEWRTRHIVERFSWSRVKHSGAMIRVTFRGSSGKREIEAFEAEDAQSKGTTVKTNKKASGGKLVEISQKDAEITRTLQLDAGSYRVTVRGYGPTPNQDAFYVRLDDGKKKRLFMSGWGEKSVRIDAAKSGAHTLRIVADPREVGMMIDRIEIASQGDERLWLPATSDWEEFGWDIDVPNWARSAMFEMFNYYADGQVLWSGVTATTGGSDVLKNGALAAAGDGKPQAWRYNPFKTESTAVYLPKGGPKGAPAAGAKCADSSQRGAWGQGISVKGGGKLRVEGSYLARSTGGAEVSVTGGMAGMISSHPYESAMDTTVCGLALYEHSALGRKWYDISVNYLAGISCGHGFDEAWNEGAGYGTSKCKWLANATLYYDTALNAGFGKSPFFPRLGEWFRRIIPVGMNHHAWGNQANASRGNHLAHFRKFAYLTGDGRFLYNWQAYGGKKFNKFRPWIEYVLPYYYQEPKPKPESDYADVFPIAGWAMAASGPPSDPKTYKEGAGVVFQCRTRGGYGHSFNSDSSFQLHAFGQMLNHGGGSSGNGDAYAYHTMSHNTLLIDGLGMAQPSSGMLYPTYGRVVGYREGDDFVYMAGDPTRCYPHKPGNFSRWSLDIGDVYKKRALPYLDHFVRHILFVKNRYFVIYDDVECTKPATYTWLYHIQPEGPFAFDQKAFAVNYGVGDVGVVLKHLAHPGDLKLEDRKGMDAYVNPMTGEDYRKTCKAKKPCGHNLWISTREPQAKWAFLAVVYPTRPGEKAPAIERLDDATARVGDDILCFDPASPSAAKATIVVDTAKFRSAKP